MLNSKRKRSKVLSKDYEQLSDIEKEKIREHWEKRNYNEFNSWCQNTKCQLDIIHTEIEISKKFKTQLRLLDPNKSLPTNIKIQCEAFGSSKKDSKSNALKKLTDQLLEFDIIQLGIKDWKFLSGNESNRERELIKDKNKISQVKISLCPNYSLKNEKPPNISKGKDNDNKQIKNEQENVKAIVKSSKANNVNVLNESAQNKQNPKKEKNKLVTTMIQKLCQNNFESAFSLYEDLVKIASIEWGEFSYLWFHAIKRRSIENVDRLINLINTNPTIQSFKSEIKSTGDEDNFSSKEMKGKDNLNIEQALNNNFENDQTISRILNLSQTNINILDNNNLNTVINNDLYDLAAYPTSNNLNCASNVVNESLFPPASYNTGIMPSANFQGNFGNIYPPQNSNLFPFNSLSNPYENFLQQIVFNNYMALKENQQMFDMNNLNFMNQPNNFINNYNMQQNMNMNMNMYNHNIGMYNPPMNIGNFGAMKNNIMNFNSPQTMNNNIQGVNYGINNSNNYQQQHQSNHDQNISTTMFTPLNNAIKNNFCEREEDSNENNEYFPGNVTKQEEDLFSDQCIDSEIPYSNQFIESVYESLLFSDDLGNYLKIFIKNRVCEICCQDS